MLKKDDYDKILKFTLEMNNYINGLDEVSMFEALNHDVIFREYILNLMSQIFDFQHVAFFLTDENELYTNPVRIVNANYDYLLRLYDRCYYELNIFSFKETPSPLLSKKLLKMSDVKEYNEDIYHKYLELHKNCGYCDVVTLPLKIDDRLSGAVVIYRTNSMGQFKNKDLELLRMLSDYLTQGLKTYLKISQYMYKQNVQDKYTNNLSTGVIILDSDFSIVNYNNKAMEFCEDILGSKAINTQGYSDSMHIQQVINQFFPITNLESTNKCSNTYIDIDNYSVEISSFEILNYNGTMKTNYAVNIVNTIPKLKIALKKATSYYDLTNRELDIVILIVDGYTNKEISVKLYISSHTVKTHIYNIFKKLDVKNRSAIVRKISEII